jgi:hypothetical protein
MRTSSRALNSSGFVSLGSKPTNSLVTTALVFLSSSLSLKEGMCIAPQMKITVPKISSRSRSIQKASRIGNRWAILCLCHSRSDRGPTPSGRLSDIVPGPLAGAVYSRLYRVRLSRLARDRGIGGKFAFPKQPPERLIASSESFLARARFSLVQKHRPVQRVALDGPEAGVADDSS